MKARLTKTILLCGVLLLAAIPNARTSETIGVPECDAYIQSMERCLEGVPASDRAILSESLSQTIEEWRKRASSESSGALVSQCRMASELAQITSSYGCKF